MRDSKTAWIGRCYLTKGEGAAQERFEAFAAVFCKGRKDFEERLRSFITPQGLQLDYAEDVLTTVDWLSCFGHNLTVVTLSQSVHDLNRVAMGPVMTMGAIQDDEPEPPKSYLTIIEHEIEALPDQSGIPFWDRQWITPGLKDLLFGQPEDGSILHTYCIINASLRKQIVEVFDLDNDSIDVPIRCLFKGKAAEELKQVAPYLLDMTLEKEAWDDDNLIPRFHKDLFTKHWGHNSGVFVRTSAPFATVWKHFRRFTQATIQEDGKHVFFMFHDPRVLPGYLQNISFNAEKVRCFCTEYQGAGLHFIVERGHTTVFEAVPDMAKLVDKPRQGFVLSYADFQSQAETEKRNRAIRIASRIKQDFSIELAERSLDDIVACTMKVVDRFNAYGFVKQEHIHLFVAWSIFFGEGFEEKDPEGLLQAICRSTASEDERFIRFKTRFDGFTVRQMETV